MRVSFFIDGFNLYHAIAEHVSDHVKWLNIRALCEQFAPTPNNQIEVIYYFSAFATWLQDAYRRHQLYVSALRAVGVETRMGKFKEKERYCRRCGRIYRAHEEKESDVSLGIQLVRDALKDRFDKAFVVSADSDLAPAVRMVRRECPDKQVLILQPPDLPRNYDLIKAAGGRGFGSRIQWIHIERSLFPEEVKNHYGMVVAIRPQEYDPPIH